MTQKLDHFYVPPDLFYVQSVALAKLKLYNNFPAIVNQGSNNRNFSNSTFLATHFPHLIYYREG